MSNSGEFIRLFNEFAQLAHNTSKAKGWYDKGVPDDSVLLINIIREATEAWEGIRIGNPPDEKCPEFSQLEVELADVVIRVMDTAQARGLRVAEALIAKMGYNATRSYRHGGKVY